MMFTKLFLKAKHWQLFLLTFGVAMITQMFMVTAIFSEIGKRGEPDISIMANYFRLIPIIVILYMIVHFGWFWSVATGLKNRIPEAVKLNMNLFKVFFFIPLVYIILFSMFIWMALSNVFSHPQNFDGPDLMAIGRYIGIIIPLHFFSMFCMFYTFYFVAKTIRTAELQRETSFSDFTGEFFLIWFYPIGIWLIQPRINKLVEHDSPEN